jgi:hypothetical protein
MTNKGFVVALALFAACAGKKESDSKPSAAGARTLPAVQDAAARRFGDAVLAKDYNAAYAMMAAAYKQDTPYDEFLKSIGRYRDPVTAPLKVSVRASDDDPATLKDDAMVQMLVPEALRSQIAGEAILDFEPEGDAEGWTLVMWLVDEGGQIHVLNYYQDD